MKLARRQFLHLAAGAVALPLVSQIARAKTYPAVSRALERIRHVAKSRRTKTYPARPVRIIVGFPAGGTADIVARLTGQSLSERLGRPFLIENRPGASMNIATELVVRAPADGYTLLLATAANAINATVYDKLKFNFIRDIAPVAGIVRVPLVMEVNPSVPIKTVPEFIAYAKANPGKLNIASAGSGTTVHIAGELFKMMAGLKMLDVPYRGSAPALIDLIGGRVHVMFDPMPSSIEYIRSGKLRALAVTTATRSMALPDIPTVGDFVPGYEASAWQGIGVPKKTPAEIIDRLNKEIDVALADPKMKARFADLGAVPMPMIPADFGKLIAEETDKWGKVAKSAGIKPI